MLDGIKGHIVHEGKVTALTRVNGETDVTEMAQHSAFVETSRMPVEEFIAKHAIYLDDIAEQFAESQSKQVIGAMSQSTEKTGNVVDGTGRPFSEDLLYETLEKMSHSFSATGEWQPPSLVVGPDLYKRIMEYENTRTPEQRQKFDEKLKMLIQKKKAEYDSEQAGRILAG